MYLLGEVGGYHYQQALWTLRATQKLVLLDLTAAEIDLMADLMTKYRDTPMDLADASLVAIMEGRGIQPLFTRDSDFYIYRLRNGLALVLVPLSV